MRLLCSIAYAEEWHLERTQELRNPIANVLAVAGHNRRKARLRAGRVSKDEWFKRLGHELYLARAKMRLITNDNVWTAALHAWRTGHWEFSSTCAGPGGRIRM